MKLYSFDLDGTLMPSGMTEIPEKIIDRLNSILEKGDIILYNSGRPFEALKNFVSRASKGNVFYAVCNGAGIYDKDGHMIFYQGISHSYFIDSYLKNPSYSVYSYTSDNEILYFEESKYIDFEAMVNGQDKHIIKVDEEEPDTISFKLLFSAEPEILDTVNVNYNSDKYSLIRTKGNMAELMDINVDKQSAIEFIVKRCRLNPDDVYAFGDADNDYLSIKCYNGACSSISTELCKKYAKYISSKNEDEWVIDALNYFDK